MNGMVLGFVAGTAFLVLLPTLPGLPWLVSLLLIPAIWSHTKLRSLAGLLIGFCWSLFWANVQLSGLLPAKLEGKDLQLTGVVSSLPVIKGAITRFEMEVLRLAFEDQVMDGPRKLRLSWFRTQAQLEPGQVWHLKVRLKRPRGYQNPGGFDYERWLFTHGIQATGYVKTWDGNRLQEGGYHGGWLNRLRQRIGLQIDQQLEDRRVAGLVKALAIGERSGLSSQDWRMLSDTGTSHLIAISGLHIGMVAGLTLFLGQWLWRRSAWLTLKLAALRAGALAGLLAGTTYAALAGFSLPTQRALVMLSLGLGAILLGRTLFLGRSLVLAMLGVVLLDPFAILSVGFWLSFGAVAVILLAVGGRITRQKIWREWGRVQWAVALGLAPLLFLLFNKASVIAPLVNLVMVPWFSFVLVPLVLLTVGNLSIGLPAGILVNAVALLCGLTLDLLVWLSQLPFAQMFAPDLSVWGWVTAFVGVILLLLPKGIPGRLLGCVLIMPAVLNQPQRPKEGGMSFTLLDVGQGLSSVVETANHVLVYDTGPAYASGFNTAEAVLLPYLRSRGIDRVDRMVISNGDRDHSGGINNFLQQMEVSTVLVGEPMGLGTEQRCTTAVRWSWDGVDFQILHPEEADRFGSSNDLSCVLKVTGGGGSVLIAGDVERNAERLLVQRSGKQLRADILVVPHHGSNTSSTEAFVSHVKPSYALFPVGYHNRFGFPHPAVVERWRQSGARLMNTADSGAIRFQLPAQRPLAAPQLYRERRSHIWSDNRLRPE